MNSELRYEKEIKLDEERIANYYDTLPFFLDLPGENEAIRDRMRKMSKEKVCTFEEPDTLRHFIPVWDEAEADENGMPPFPEYSGMEDMLDMLDGIIVAYSERFALEDDAALNDRFLQIICQGGKTLARVSDLIYTGSDDHAAAAVLARRSLADVGDLAAMVNEVQKISNAEKKGELEVLQYVRQKILNILFAVQQ